MTMQIPVSSKTYSFELTYFFSDGAKESDLQDLMTELTILKEVNKMPHPNIIKLVGGCSIGGLKIILRLFWNKYRIYKILIACL